MTTTIEKPAPEGVLQLDLPLTEREADQLRRCEAVIEEGLKTFYRVGTALMKIRDGQLYRVSHKTFEAYLATRWGIKRAYAYSLMSAVETVANLDKADLSAIADILPVNEAQARPLNRLPAEQQPDAWIDAVHSAGDGPVTAAHVQRAVEARLPDKPQAPVIGQEDTSLFRLGPDGESGWREGRTEADREAEPAQDEEQVQDDAETIPLAGEDLPAQDDEAAWATLGVAHALRSPEPVADVAGLYQREPDVPQAAPGSRGQVPAAGVDSARVADALPASDVLASPSAPAAAPLNALEEQTQKERRRAQDREKKERDEREKKERDERTHAEIQARHEAGKAYRQSLLDARSPQLSSALACLESGLVGLTDSFPVGSPVARALAVIVGYALCDTTGPALSETVEALGLPLDATVIDEGWEEFSDCLDQYAQCDGASLIRLALGTIVRDEASRVDADNLRCTALDWFSPAVTVPVQSPTVAEAVSAMQEALEADRAESEPAAEDEPCSDRPAFRVFGPAADEQECAACNALIDLTALDELAGVGPDLKSPVTAKDGTLLTPHWVLYCPDCAPDVDICRVCGCTAVSACEGGCYWVSQAKDLCSSCVDDHTEPGAPLPAPLPPGGDPSPVAPEPGPFLTVIPDRNVIQEKTPVLREDPWDAVHQAPVPALISEPSPDRTAFVSAEFIAECTEWGVNCCGKIGGKKNSVISHPVTFEGELYAVVGTSFLPGGGREARASRMVPKERWGGPINIPKQLTHTYFGIEATHDGKSYVLDGGTVTFKLAGSEQGDGPDSELRQDSELKTETQDEVCLGAGCKAVIPGSVVLELCNTPGAYSRGVLSKDGTLLMQKGQLLCPSCASKEVLPSPYPDAPITAEYFTLQIPVGYKPGDAIGDPVYSLAVEARRLAVPGVPDYDMFTHYVKESQLSQRRVMKIADGRSGANFGTVQDFDEAKAWVTMFHQDGSLRSWVDSRLIDFPRSPRYVVPAPIPAPPPVKASRRKKAAGKAVPQTVVVTETDSDPYDPEPDICRLCRKNPANFFGTCAECDGTFHNAADNNASDNAGSDHQEAT